MITRQLLIKKVMQAQYDLLVERHGYNLANKLMQIGFTEEWEDVKEEIWQTHDLTNAEKCDTVII